MQQLGDSLVPGVDESLCRIRETDTLKWKHELTNTLYFEAYYTVLYHTMIVNF